MPQFFATLGLTVLGYLKCRPLAEGLMTRSLAERRNRFATEDLPGAHVISRLSRLEERSVEDRPAERHNVPSRVYSPRLIHHTVAFSKSNMDWP